MKHLVADMAAVSRAEERQLDLHPRPVDLGALSEDAVAAASARYAAAGVGLDVQVVAQVLVVRADRQRLAEALANLLDNVLRHTPRGCTVRVVVRAGPHGAVLEVADIGEGFDPSASERIFERFYRADYLEPQVS